MMTDQADTAEQKQAIARLVSQGKMTHENPGQYINADVDDESRGAIPAYDVAAIREAMPDILQLDFDEDAAGCWAVLEDGKSGDSVKVMLGADQPATTEELIAIVQAHYREQLGLDSMDETADAFAAFEDMD